MCPTHLLYQEGLPYDQQMHMLFPSEWKVSVPLLLLSLIPSLNLSAWRRSAPLSDLPSPLPFSPSFGRNLGSNSPEISPEMNKFLLQKQMTVSPQMVCIT